METRVYPQQTAAYQGATSALVYQAGQIDAPARPQGPIEGLVSQIESRISGLFDVSHRTEQAMNRLLNPRPAEVGKNSADTPAPQTIEGRMQSIVRMLDAVDARFRDQAERLDSAV